MIKTLPKNSIEFILFFILYPIFLAISIIPLNYKLYTVPFVFTYVLYVSYLDRKVLFIKRKFLQPPSFWRTTSFRLLMVIVSSLIYILITNKDLLFISILTQPVLWVKMIFVYTVFSVIPQEYVYRVLYFHRYKDLFKSPNTFFLVNAFVFSLGHLMFQSTLVLIITFIGGLLFANTYQKTKSIFWVSVEHLIYGGWLFTVGMGKMLGFPI
ncbi:CPBP family intramembrane metalloprotease [Wenyingzhuangia sp. chi5]|uniref:CPBP family intramembrane metalloprotease n=1 Tax=Wenyingzhuangia gilva TaxID=3057677 RepID=A0ABT8VP59_9FLAO|nr:CPBP family intramembrane glutamic endopeptidase [Wenyingzhuangia sp. chi5]MDO3693753.1 CPBP family intramembrane metalloprotease [Wenyingzhuangia sp. chi5]